MKKNILLTIIISLILSGTASAAEFTDVDNSHPNFVPISHLNDSGVINGYPDGSFQPDKVLNRVEALKVILEGSGIASPDEINEAPFPDTPADQWYSKYVLKAKELGIVKGNPDGTFAPDKQVKLVEFIKMLLEANRFSKDKWEGQEHYNDVPGDQWYTGYMNYAGKSGLVTADLENKLYPEAPVNRGKTAEILYLMKIILKGDDTQFLLEQSELQMAQIDIFISAKNILAAKRAADLAYDITQQALANSPDNNVVLGAAKIAKAYQLLMDTFIAGIKNENELARTLAEQTKLKATEAWEANNDIQAIAKHIKERADEILSQL